MKELKRLLQFLWVPEEPLAWRGLAVYPVYRRPEWETTRLKTLPYLVLSEALAAEVAVVRELEQARVPELSVENQGGTPILALDGDELLGGKQNRILNASVLLPQGCTTVPVSCVERQRWELGGRADFRGGERLPYGLRAVSHGHVADSLHSHGGHASDQRAIWSHISHGHGSSSQTEALHGWYEAQKQILASYVEAVPYPKNALGMVVGIGGHLAGCDLFDQPRTAELYWARLIRSSAAEALRNAQHRQPVESPMEFLERLQDCEPQDFPSPGLGRDLRLTGSGLFGSALVHDEVVVHLSLFAQSIQAKLEV